MGQGAVSPSLLAELRDLDVSLYDPPVAPPRVPVVTGHGTSQRMTLVRFWIKSSRVSDQAHDSSKRDARSRQRATTATLAETNQKPSRPQKHKNTKNKQDFADRRARARFLGSCTTEVAERCRGGASAACALAVARFDDDGGAGESAEGRRQGAAEAVAAAAPTAKRRPWWARMLLLPGPRDSGASERQQRQQQQQQRQQQQQQQQRQRQQEGARPRARCEAEAARACLGHARAFCRAAAATD